MVATKQRPAGSGSIRRASKAASTDIQFSAAPTKKATTKRAAKTVSGSGRTVKAETPTPKKSTAPATKKAAAKKAPASKSAAPAKKATAKKAPASKQVATKTVEKKATASRKPAAQTAKKPVKKAATPKVAAPAAKKAASRKRSPIMVDGKPGSNRHFAVPVELHAAALERLRETGSDLPLSVVLRHGLELYARKAPKEDVAIVRTSFPRNGQAALKRLWRTGDATLFNAYLAKCFDDGWTLQAIANSMIEAGLVDSMSRQATSGRVKRGAESGIDPDSLPDTPKMGPRRPMPSPRKGLTLDEYRAQLEREGSSEGFERHDVAFRVTDEVYDAVVRRARHEGGMISSVVENTLRDFIDGAYDRKLRIAA